jgi:O-antigen/teichoic acid export membrane protein
LLNAGASVKAVRSARLRRLSKEGLWVVVGYALAVLGALAGIRLLTELLGPREYGELALGMTIAMLVNQAVLGPLCQGAIRFYAAAVERQDFSGYWSAVRRLTLLATAALIVLAPLGIAALLASGLVHWIGLLCAGLVFAVLSAYTAILGGIQNAARRRAVAALHQGIEGWARFLVAAVLLLAFGGGSTTAMTGYAVAALLVLASQYWFFRRSVFQPGEAKDSGSWERQIRSYSWPIAIFGAFTWGQVMSDRWALQVFASTQDVGLYAALFQLGYYPNVVLAGVAVQFLVPIYFQRAGDARDSQRNAQIARLTWHLTAGALAVTAAGCAVAFLLHAEIFHLLVAAEYASVSPLLPWVLLAGGFFAAAQIVALGLMTQLRTYELMWAKIGTALFGIACNFLGAYWFGIAGVAAAGVLFSAACFLWMGALLQREKPA